MGYELLTEECRYGYDLSMYMYVGMGYGYDLSMYMYIGMECDLSMYVGMGYGV